ncbi:HET-domain-containing protein [Polyplosphaeria fusca]|uniref:HET-domain-containing protein n=1 Tax=Polyplosphaeria fusca TaxID=682080 RepID=A0A9P4QHT1_9PLEO|nr:HET-domain-containing protein [Polyplosphaeria fusca]
MRKEEYVALSHRWGSLSVEEKMEYCTTQENIDKRLLKGFRVSELPQTFQDAITVTRQLGILYLWIDSLCIIQYGDNEKDWEIESKRMESVFSGACCTIAATAAEDSKAGFLHRRTIPRNIHVRDDSGKQFYISTDIDDFDKDVDKAELNKRAWVMQEAVLSKRTIHFSSNQIYWECGEGVYCENLVKLESRPQGRFFTLDPVFPSHLLRAGEERTLKFISFLIQNYSERSLTVPSDRSIAVAGLLDRVAGTLKCRCRYGVFELYLHRNLLWQASNSGLKEITYNHDHRVPSWSWMAYSGGINFLNIEFGKVEWINHLRFDEESRLLLVAKIGRFQDCALQPDGRCYAVLGFKGKEVGSIQYDVDGDEEFCEKKCVPLGRTRTWWHKTKYYVIVVRSTGVVSEYRRIGVGWIQSSYIEQLSSDVRIV